LDIASMIRKPCPTSEDLLRWLDEQLVRDERAGIGTHVDNCGHCQEKLEEITCCQAYGLDSLDAQPLHGLPRDTSETAAPINQHAGSTELVEGLHDGSAAANATAGLNRTLYHLSDQDRIEPHYSVDETNVDAMPTNADATVDPSPAGTEPDAGLELPNPRSTIPAYEILELIGEGGMGVVYKARQRGLNRLVALKMIRGGTQPRPDYLARIRIEAEAVARLRHPNIVQIYEIGEVDGLPFLSLELLEGGTLEDRLASNPQPGRTAADLMATLARAMQTAHTAGIIHRDLNPSNILFTRDGIPRIIDFGLAKRLEAESHQTESGQIMGTPCYMAPEQAMGHTNMVGPPADIYALGAILYEMLTGRPPFKGETRMETVRQVTSDDVVAPRRLVPTVAKDLETICLHSLNKEPSRRYHSAIALAEDLECFLGGHSITARRTPLWERGVKLARRRPVATTLCTLGLVATLGLSGAWLRYSTLQQSSERQEIQRQARVERKNVLAVVRAKDLLDRQQWSDAEPLLTGIQAEIRDETDLGDLRTMATAMLEQAKAGRAIEAARSRDHERFRTFLGHRREALIHETWELAVSRMLSDPGTATHFTGLDLPANPEAIRKSTRAALAVFARPGSEDSWAIGPLPASLTQREHEQVKEGCYEMLMILAEAVDQPDRGLRLLDQAAELRPPTRVYHLRRADLLARRGDAAASDTERARAKTLQTSSALDHFLSGKEEYKRREWSAALSHFDEALLIQPEHFWAHCLSAICGLQLSRPIQAKADLNACLQTEPGFAWLYELRGFASYQVAALARLAAENLESKGSSLRAEVQSQLKAAETDFATALELLRQRPNDELQYVLLVNRALLWLERGEWSKATADLEAAIRLNGAGWQALGNLAVAYDRQGKPDEAIEQFTRAITLQPDLAQLYRARADVDRRRKDQNSAQRERALRDLETAIRLDPPGSSFVAVDQTNRGTLLLRQGRDSEALAACDGALEVDPNFLVTHRLKIDVLRKLKRQAEVIRSCDALLTRGKPSAELYELRALAKQELSDYQGAIEDDTLAIALRPGNPALLERRGGLFLITDAPRSALRDFDESIRLDPSSPSSTDAYLGRGLARVTLGLHREAVADASRAVRLGEPTDLRLYNAARIYARAAIAAGAEVKKTGQDAVGLVSRYQDQAVALVRQAVTRLPAAERPKFARDVVQTDPALATLRHRFRSLELAGSTISSDRPGPQARN
jgi:eukaryotic-like serine/threonine-protein kinase